MNTWEENLNDILNKIRKNTMTNSTAITEVTRLAEQRAALNLKGKE